ncbi:MAG: hypothetical protein J6X58_03205 [Bacteroidales bacterium]|nr:hypothetical protein [Bacteroidales bacterium]
MKLINLFRKRLTVADGLRLPVSGHFYYSTFAVRGRYDNSSLFSAFVCEGTPGTGFFVRNTESHSYRRFVDKCRAKNKQNLLTFILRKEPDFDKEYQRIEQVFSNLDDERKRNILASYQNVVSMAKDEEILQRIVRAIKDKMGNHPKKSLVSVLTHYKSSIASMERDVRSVQINYNKTLSDGQKEEWAKVVEAFHNIVNARRVWSVYLEDNNPAYEQVFFDMGIFDYIQSPGDTPVMRDHRDLHYYLYPDCLVRARSSVDFDFYSWNEVEFSFSVVDISTLAVRPRFDSHKRHKHGDHSDALSTLYGVTRQQVVGEIYCPALDLRFFVNHTGPAEDFVKAVNAWKNYNH